MSQTHALILANTADRQEARTLLAEITRLAGKVAEMTAEVETLRAALARFESAYQQHMARQNEQILRAEHVLRRLIRWERLVSSVSQQSALVAETHETQHDAWTRGAARVRAQHRQPNNTRRGATPQAGRFGHPHHQPITEPARAVQLKELWRLLARRFHPDLVRDETQRMHHSRMMAHINALYQQGDVGRLTALHDNSADLTDDTTHLDTATLRERRAALAATCVHLQQQRTQLRASSTYALWQQVAANQRASAGLLDHLQATLQARSDQSLNNVVQAIRKLEVAVTRSSQRDNQLTEWVDSPQTQQLMALGLEALARPLDAQTLQLAQTVQDLASTSPAVLRLLLLTYVSELSPTPLVGLEKFDDMRLRFAALKAPEDGGLPPLERALCDADAYVEYAVRRSERGAMQTSLRFVQPGLEAAVHQALASFAVREAFCDVLSVLGEHAHCDHCKCEVFFVPLYRTRGLDDLRASVCPHCGNTKRSYWLPRGNDVQGVLNHVFVDYEIVYEYAFVLPNLTVSMQLVPCQIDKLTVRDLTQRFVHDVFSRYEVDVNLSDIILCQGDTTLAPQTPLHTLSHTQFQVHLRPPTGVNWDEAVEQVQHRVRTRFQY